MIFLLFYQRRLSNRPFVALGHSARVGGARVALDVRRPGDNASAPRRIGDSVVAAATRTIQ